MAQPVNSALSVAQLTYELQLASQWIALSIGSSSASLINPPNSELEVLNLVNGTFIFANYQSIFNAANDNIYALESGSSPRLPGLINPAHLRLSAHFQGTGSFAPAAGDNPVYNSNNGSTGKMFIQGTTTLTPPNLLVGGSSSATSAETSEPVANAFDGSQTTFWASTVPALLPNSIGTPTATFLTGSGATYTWTNNGSPSGATTPKITGAIANVFDGNSATTYEILNGIQFTFSTGHSTGGNFTINYDLGAAYTIQAIQFIFNSGEGAEANNVSPSTAWSFSGGTSGSGNLPYYAWGTNGIMSGSGFPFNARFITYQSNFNNTGWNSINVNVIFYVSVANNPVTMTYQMPSGDAFAGNTYSIAATTAGKQPTAWTLQGSNDGSTWTTLDTQTGINAWPFTGSFSNSTSYLYYQVVFNGCNSTYGNDLLVGDIKVWNSSTTSPYITSGTPQIVTYDLGSGNSETGTSYTLNATQNLPTNWTLQASNDNSTWTTLDTVISYAGSFPYNKNFTNTTPYRYWRVSVTGSQFNSDVVTITNFQVSDLPAFATYDTAVKTIGGTSSLQLRFTGLRGSSQNTNEVQLGALPWQFRAFVNFDSGFGDIPNQCLFAILGKQFEIVKTSTGLNVNYSTDGSTFTTVSGTYTFTPGTWYWIAVGRDSNNVLHLNVNGTDIATANLGSTAFFNTNQVSPNFYIGMDSTQSNPFIGHIQEVEMFVGECPAFTQPVSIRSTAYVPAVNWQSKANFVPSDATTITALVFIDEVTFASFGVPAVNTDWFLNISCDNGAHFTNVPLKKVSAFSTLTNVYAATINAPTGGNNTSNLVYQITSAAGKVLKFDGLLLYWVSNSSLYPFYNNSL